MWNRIAGGAVSAVVTGFAFDTFMVIGGCAGHLVAMRDAAALGALIAVITRCAGFADRIARFGTDGFLAVIDDAWEAITVVHVIAFSTFLAMRSVIEFFALFAQRIVSRRACDGLIGAMADRRAGAAFLLIRSQVITGLTLTAF